MDAKQLLDSLEHGVAAIAPDWTIAAWTATAARITGLPAERVLGRSFWVAFPAAKATHIERVLQEVLHDGKSQTYLAPAAATDFPGMVFETQVSRGPHNHVIMVFRQVREELGPESLAAHSRPGPHRGRPDHRVEPRRRQAAGRRRCGGAAGASHGGLDARRSPGPARGRAAGRGHTAPGAAPH